MNMFHLRSSRAGLTGILTAAFLLTGVAFAAVPAAADQGGPPEQETATIVHLPPNLVGGPVLVDGASARLQRLETQLVTRTGVSNTPSGVRGQSADAAERAIESGQVRPLTLGPASTEEDIDRFMA